MQEINVIRIGCIDTSGHALPTFESARGLMRIPRILMIIYIYIYIERERDVCVYIYIYIYMYMWCWARLSDSSNWFNIEQHKQRIATSKTQEQTSAQCICCIGDFTSLDLIFVCAAFARIHRLRKSPQYLLVILHGELTVSAILRKASTKKCAEEYANLGSRNSRAVQIARPPFAEVALVIGRDTHRQPH